MTRTRATGDQRANRQPPDRPASGLTSAESQIRAEEVCRMAAFRIRETANRIATLANSARDDALRRILLATCERLLAEERALLAHSE
jgi:hypothetical protein